jgi:hypothetical protein
MCCEGVTSQQFITNFVEICIHRRFISATTVATLTTCAIVVAVAGIANIVVQKYSDVLCSDFTENAALLSPVHLEHHKNVIGIIYFVSFYNTIII